MPSKNRISVNLSEHEYEELQAVARQHDVSMAWLARQAICAFLSTANIKSQLPLDLSMPRRIQKDAQ